MHWDPEAYLLGRDVVVEWPLFYLSEDLLNEIFKALKFTNSAGWNFRIRLFMLFTEQRNFLLKCASLVLYDCFVTILGMEMPNLM